MSPDRRKFFSDCSRVGLTGLFPGVLFTLAAQSQGKAVTAEMIDQAGALSGIAIEPDQKAEVLKVLAAERDRFETVRALPIVNATPPAFVFDPMPPGQQPPPPVSGADPRQARLAPYVGSKEVPKRLDELAFANVRELGDLIKRKKVSSADLTAMYLERLKKYNPTLHFAITLTEERAMAKAKEADHDLAAGKYRGPLHGLPWGAKDIIAAKGYPTTWGAGGFEHQKFEEDATVVQRLDAAGAVLVAKLTTGALALGDRWFGGQTRNPWNPAQGSSGSSAGPASAVSAGCVAFAIGSETGGSISSPSTRCGVTGMRPTFGLIPRTGAMTLSWTMDKLGPICRAVEDCALVVQATWGPDGEDSAARPTWYRWDADYDWKQLRVGYLKSEFDSLPDATDPPAARARREYDRKFDLAGLEVLRKMGAKLKPVELPAAPYDAMRRIYTIEGAAAFDDMTRSGRDKLLTSQNPNDWPNQFRAARFYPAVEYIQLMRARTLVNRAFAKVFDEVDIIVTPTQGSQGTLTNLSGHPAVIVPNGLRGADAPESAPATTGSAPRGQNATGGPNTTVSLTFLGGLFQDAKVCAIARAYQEATPFHKLHPNLS